MPSANGPSRPPLAGAGRKHNVPAVKLTRHPQPVVSNDTEPNKEEEARRNPMNRAQSLPPRDAARIRCASPFFPTSRLMSPPLTLAVSIMPLNPLPFQPMSTYEHL